MVQAAFKLDARSLRLDDKRLERWVRKEQIKPLTRFGAILRSDARRSIKTVAPTKGLLERAKSDDARKRKRALAQIAKRKARVSEPGQPPLSHQPRKSKESIRNIQFAYDTRTSSLVAGPIKFNAKGKDVPKALEAGGQTVVYRVKKSGVWIFVGEATYRKWPGERKAFTVKLSARPTMGPALRRTGSKLPQQFRRRG